MQNSQQRIVGCHVLRTRKECGLACGWADVPGTLWSMRTWHPTIPLFTIGGMNPALLNLARVNSWYRRCPLNSRTNQPHALTLHFRNHHAVDGPHLGPLCIDLDVGDFQARDA